MLSAPSVAWTSSRSWPSSYSVSRTWRKSETAAPAFSRRSTGSNAVVAISERCEKMGVVGVEVVSITPAKGFSPPVGVEVVLNPSSRSPGPGVNEPELRGGSSKSLKAKLVENRRTSPGSGAPSWTGSMRQK
jgi:hypothetical protein